MLNQKYERKAELKDKELEVRKMEIELQKRKFEEESEERKGNDLNQCLFYTTDGKIIKYETKEIFIVNIIRNLCY